MTEPTTQPSDNERRTVTADVDLKLEQLGEAIANLVDTVQNQQSLITDLTRRMSRLEQDR